jgi:hypothetical protein
LVCEYKNCHESELILHVEDASAEAPPEKGPPGKAEEYRDIPSLESLAKTDVASEVVEGTVVEGEGAGGTLHQPQPEEAGGGARDSDSDDPGKGITSFDMSGYGAAIPLPYHGPLANGQPQENVPPE